MNNLIPLLIIAWLLNPTQGNSQEFEAMSVTDDFYNIGKKGDGFAGNGSIMLGYSDDGIEWDLRHIHDVLSEEAKYIVNLFFFDELEGILQASNNTNNEYDTFRTLDGGSSWIQEEMDVDFCTFYNPYILKVIDENTVLIQVTFSSGMYLSKDRGHTWECNSDFSVEPGTWFTTNVVSSLVWYISDADGVYKTTNGGESYNQIFNESFSATHMDSEGTMLGVTYRYNEADDIPKLYKTKDDWTTYDVVSLDDLKDEYIQIITEISPDEYLVILVNGEVHYTADGGNTFNKSQTLPYMPDYPIILDDEVFAGGRGLFRLNTETPVTLNVVDSSQELNDITIQPNPTNGMVYIDNQNIQFQYRIFSSTGMLISKGKIVDSTLDMSKAIPGLYHIVINNNEDYASYSILKI